MTIAQVQKKPFDADSPAVNFLSAATVAALDEACSSIAPTWPLDRQIAVNPWWPLRSRDFASVSARLAALGQVQCLMPPEYYRSLWDEGVILPRHLQQADPELTQDRLLDALAPADSLRDAGVDAAHWHTVSDLLDIDRGEQMTWREEITHQVSQFCAAWFQTDGPLSSGSDAGGDLYRAWLTSVRHDRGLEILMNETGLTAAFAHLPDDADTLLALALEVLGVDQESTTAYAQALLLDINGWASWVAYEAWQNGLAGRSESDMRKLLAVRMGWELALWRHTASRQEDFRQLKTRWESQLQQLPQLLADHEKAQAPLWSWQRAAELAYQESLASQLASAPVEQSDAPVLQAVFCIDVRSEPMRRALEFADDKIETLGFAGFFGLPVEYAQAGSDLRRPQLPGLLQPAITVTEATPANASKVSAADDSGATGEPASARRQRFGRIGRWLSWTRGPTSSFSFVEAAGLAYGGKLLSASFAPKRTARSQACGSAHWHLHSGGETVPLAARVNLVTGILKGMGLRRFAPVVLLVGHGSETTNNAQGNGLDCGACGGQSGDINAQVLAQLLNDSDVRSGLADNGIAIPASTKFVAALHNTTTDELQLHQREGLPAKILQWLDDACVRARRTRASTLGLEKLDDAALAKALRARAGDWSELRPEWGLANNAAFIVAPRSHTRHLDLQGRTFLHDYSWASDEGFGVLEQIMTAPMIVTNWINMQYNASVTDNRNYGSGNKILHNVVGGRIGIFEGNGGDLRIGLARQSLHDGKQWRHQPLRLSVYIAAPAAAIADICQRHGMISELVDNDWLYLFRLSDEGDVARYYRSEWRKD